MTINPTRILIFLTVITGFLGTFAIADDSSQTVRSNTFWLSIGEGLGTGGGSIGMGASYEWKGQIFSARITHSNDLAFFRGMEPEKYLEEVSLLYGFDLTGASDFVSVAVGLCIVQGKDRGEFLYTSSTLFGPVKHYEEKPISTIGLSFESQHYWRPFSFFGLGAHTFLIAIKGKVLFGALFSIQLGKLE